MWYHNVESSIFADGLVTRIEPNASESLKTGERRLYVLNKNREIC